MSVTKQGKTYLTIDEMDTELSKMAKIDAKKFANGVIKKQKISQKQYI